SALDRRLDLVLELGEMLTQLRQRFLREGRDVGIIRFGALFEKIDGLLMVVLHLLDIVAVNVASLVGPPVGPAIVGLRKRYALARGLGLWSLDGRVIIGHHHLEETPGGRPRP